MNQPDIQQMMQQVQKMQQDMAAAQESLESQVIEVSSGGGSVNVSITGGLEVREIKIASEMIDPADPELLQDAVVAAVNEAIRQAQELSAQKLSGATGGLDLGSLGLNLPGF